LHLIAHPQKAAERRSSLAKLGFAGQLQHDRGAEEERGDSEDDHGGAASPEKKRQSIKPCTSSIIRDLQKVAPAPATPAKHLQKQRRTCGAAR
jgi:hypothetical protein